MSKQAPFSSALPSLYCLRRSHVLLCGSLWNEPQSTSYGFNYLLYTDGTLFPRLPPSPLSWCGPTWHSDYKTAPFGHPAVMVGTELFIFWCGSFSLYSSLWPSFPRGALEKGYPSSQSGLLRWLHICLLMSMSAAPWWLNYHQMPPPGTLGHSIQMCSHISSLYPHLMLASSGRYLS